MASGPSSLDDGLDRATLALEKSEDYKASKAERFLNAAGNAYETVTGATSSPYVTSTQDVVTAGLDLLQPQLDNFKASCDILMKTLDAVAKVHPFVTVAVLAFKAAITFELTRRQNDKRMLALHVTMKDLMSVVGLLRNLAKDDRGADGLTIQQRLHDRMKGIAKDIETCAATCDTFHKKKLIVKVFKSISWEGKLEAFAAAFDSHKEALQKDLSMHASLGIERANKTLATIEITAQSSRTSLDMLLLFQQLRSPEERELRKFIESKGGADRFLKDGELMEELVALSRRNEEEDGSQVNSQMIKSDLKKDLEDLIQEGIAVSDNKFRALQINIRAQMETSMRREGDRIIGTLLSGPHDRIIDPNVWEIWTEMGWKGSTKARHLVVALREYFAERYADVETEESEALAVVPAAGTTGAQLQARKRPGIRIADRWTLEYISLLRLQPLLEAFDDDASTFVTVAEANAFTQTRPPGWSLPHWLAYWTIGFPLSVQYYYRRIKSVTDRIWRATMEVHPSNRMLIQKFMSSTFVTSIDLLLAGAYEVDVRWDEELFKKFKPYVDQEERRIKETLETINYFVDSPDTPSLLSGTGRLERYLFPFTYLLVLRLLQVISAGRDVSLRREELFDLTTSLNNIPAAVVQRLRNVTAMMKLQSLDRKPQLKMWAFGILYYFEYNEEVFASPYFKSEYYNVSTPGDSPDRFHEADHKQLPAFTPHLDRIDTEGYCVLPPRAPSEGEPASQTPFGERCWRGFYEADGFTPSIGHIDMNDLPTRGGFTNAGIDSMGEFVVEGSRDGTHITLTRQYMGRPTSYTYRGEINEDEDEIIGKYGVCTNHRENLKDEIGGFVLKRRPLCYFLYRQHQEPAENRAKSLWKFALTAVLHAVRVRATHVPWEFFAERRQRRRRYVELYAKYDEWVGNWKEFAMLDLLTEEECEEWSQLEISSTAADLLFYRSLADYFSRREVGFFDISCNGCDRKWLPMTRILCLECSSAQDAGYVNSLDFCASCAKEQVIPDGSNHSTSHHLLQLRRFVPSQLSLSLILQAQDTLSTRFPEEPTCTRCKIALSTRFWSCMECEGNVYVCEGCNFQEDQDRVSLFHPTNERYRAIRGIEPHHWSHMMVMFDNTPEAPASPSSDERLAALEGRIRDMEAAMAVREAEFAETLRRMEIMIGHLVRGASASNSPGE